MADSYKRTITLGLDYSSFSEGMKDCNSKMRELDSEFKASSAEMEKTASNSQKLEKRTEYLTEKIELQNKKVQIAKDRYDELVQSGTATERQIQAAAVAFNKESEELSKLNNQMADTVVQQSHIKESFTAMIAVVGALTAAFTKCAVECAEYADNILTLSQQTDVSTDTLQKWSYAADLVDVSLETMTGSLTKLEKSMDGAKDKTSAQGKVFRELGVQVKDSSGHLRNAEDVFYDVIDALGKIPNATERDIIAMEIFGKSAESLTGVIEAGSEGLKAYGDEAERLGLIMSEDELQAAGQFQDALDKLDAQLTAMKNNIGMEIIPILTKMVEAINKIPAPVLATVATIMAVVAGVVAVAAAVASVIKVAKQISALLGPLTGAMDTTYVKILLIVGAVTALVAAIVVLIGKGKELQSTLNSVGNASIGGGSGGARVGHNATGTQNWRGGPTWVGENGPELVDVPAGSRIYNTEDSRNFGHTTYNINMNCDLSKMKDVNDVVKAVKGIKQSAACGGAY